MKENLNENEVVLAMFKGKDHEFKKFKNANIGLIHAKKMKAKGWDVELTTSKGMNIPIKESHKKISSFRQFVDDNLLDDLL